MPRNAHKPGASAGNTFRADEIRAIEQLFTLLDRRADPAVVLRSDALARVRRKFASMRTSLERQKAGAQ